MLSRMVLAAVTVVTLALGAGCETIRPPVEQRTTQGPKAEEFWLMRMMAANGRPPAFDERRHWDDEMDTMISRYLREHPEAANSLQLSTFRFYRQAAVGMTKEQILILLGPPLTVTTDQAAIEQLARRFWPEIRGNATEAWVYPLGWHLYFAGPRVVDITQYLPR